MHKIKKNSYKKAPTKRDRTKDRRAAAPFLLLEGDPTNFWGDDKPIVKSPKATKQGKPKKVLTNLKQFARLNSISKAKTKGDKMATDKKQKQSNRNSLLVSGLWLGLAAQQALVGFTLLANSSNILVIVAALISLGITAVIIGAHFFVAHK